MFDSISVILELILDFVMVGLGIAFLYYLLGPVFGIGLGAAYISFKVLNFLHMRNYDYPEE